MEDRIRSGRDLAFARDAAPLTKLLILIAGLVLQRRGRRQPRAATTVAPFTGRCRRSSSASHTGRAPRELAAVRLPRCQRRPIGYSLDFCEVVVEEVGQLCTSRPRVNTCRSRPTNRFDLVKSGAVDLECGSTTASAERRAPFDFSPPIFVTGTKLLVKRGSGIRSLRDLQGKTVVLTSGTVHADTDPEDRATPEAGHPVRVRAGPRRVLPGAGRGKPTLSPTTTCSCTARSRCAMPPPTTVSSATSSPMPTTR